MKEPKPEIEKEIKPSEKEKSEVDAKIERISHEREMERKYGTGLERLIRLHEQKKKEAQIESLKAKRIEEKEEEIEKIRKKLGIKVEEPPKKEEKEKEKIWKIVEEFVGIPEEERKEYDDIILDDSENAYKFREEELELGHKEVFGTIAKIKSERARKFLLENLGKGEKQKNWREITRALIGNDTRWADEIREWLRFDKEARSIPLMGKKIGRIRAGINAKIFAFLGFNKSEWWFNFRKVIDRVFPRGFYLPADLLLSEIDVPAENETKKKLLEEFGEQNPAEAILSFFGDSSEEAQQSVKRRYGGDKKLEWAYQKYRKSIGKLSSAEK